MANLKDLIEPMPGKIAVQIKAAEEITRGGLYLPVETVRSQHEAKPVQGVIVAIGDDDLEEPDTFLKVGDTVVFGKYAGVELSYQPPPANELNVLDRPARAPRERIVLLSHKDILARIKALDENIKVKG